MFSCVILQQTRSHTRYSRLLTARPGRALWTCCSDSGSLPFARRSLALTLLIVQETTETIDLAYKGAHRLPIATDRLSILPPWLRIEGVSSDRQFRQLRATPRDDSG